jgi:hypothetical protein
VDDGVAARDQLREVGRELLVAEMGADGGEVARGPQVQPDELLGLRAVETPGIASGAADERVEPLPGVLVGGDESIDVRRPTSRGRGYRAGPSTACSVG